MEIDHNEKGVTGGTINSLGNKREKQGRREEIDNSNRRKYCFFFNNARCERKDCKFVHEKAPRCRNDGDCEFFKLKNCRFSHERQVFQKEKWEMKDEQVEQEIVDKTIEEMQIFSMWEKVCQEIQRKEYFQYLQQLQYMNQVYSWNQGTQDQGGYNRF